jgi:prephenate dehydrogenase
MIRIAIIGMGLIGTALGISLRSADSKKDPMGEIEVIGYDANTDHLKEARARLAIDKMAPSMLEAVKGVHLVVLAVPALALREVLATIAPGLEPGAVVTDVTSTKGQVAAWARELLATGNPFVGGHPMAGREQSGPKAAVHDLFKGAVYCLCPDVHSPPEAIALCEAMVERVGAKAYFIDPVEHDAYVAGISHMPFVMASLLVHVTTQASSWREMSALAAGGYRDTTRLASGDVTMHRDIIMTNAEAINRWIDVCVDELQGLKRAIADGDQAAIQDYLHRTKQARDEWLKQKPGMRPGEAEYEDMGMGMVERPSLFGRRTGGRSS